MLVGGAVGFGLSGVPSMGWMMISVLKVLQEEMGQSLHNNRKDSFEI